MEYALTPPPLPSVAIAGRDTHFPVRRIYCVGRNYAEHAREMGNDDREPPFFFTKPNSAIVPNDSTIPFPPATENFHYEAELVVAIGKAGTDVPLSEALDHVWGYATGNDLTRRDVQAAAKKMARPWDMAKGFDLSAPCGPVHPVSDIGHLESGAITLTQNGILRQNTDLSDMVWSVPEVISYLSGLVTLEPGDLIYTGTPAGVGPISKGDTLVVEIEGLTGLTTRIAE
ncbi:MAG: fumarylacetoacetate hydrolase family protein [Marinosulfonomonas sp.]